jgi:hypothetical protein
MAYIDQKMKAVLLPEIKTVFKKYNFKGSVSIKNNSSLVVTISKGKHDIIGNYNLNSEYFDHSYMQVNHYYIRENFSGLCKDFLLELLKAMRGNIWYDKSDIQTDYFDTAYYLNIHIGRWNKPYVIE